MISPERHIADAQNVQVSGVFSALSRSLRYLVARHFPLSADDFAAQMGDQLIQMA